MELQPDYLLFEPNPCTDYSTSMKLISYHKIVMRTVVVNCVLRGKQKFHQESYVHDNFKDIYPNIISS